MDAAEQSGTLIGLGSGAMAGTVFGALWIGLSLAAAKAFSWWLTPLFIVCCVGLETGSLWLIRRGKKLRSQSAASSAWPTGMRKRFIWTVIAEASGCVAIVWICNAVQRYDLIAVGIAVVVGLHFIPLAQIFRAPIYYATAIAITAWCAASVVSFRGQEMDIAAGIGTGIVLWLTAAHNLSRSRQLLTAEPAAIPPLS